MSPACEARKAAIAGLIPELDQLAIETMADWKVPAAALAVVELPRHDWVHLPGDRAVGELLAPMRHLEPSRDIRTAYQ